MRGKLLTIIIKQMQSKKPVALVVGGSRGIGRQVAIDLAKNGYAVVVAAKTSSDAATCEPFPPNPNTLQSTISTVTREIIETGGDAIAVQVDVRDFSSVEALVEQTVRQYKRLDVLIYNRYVIRGGRASSLARQSAHSYIRQLRTKVAQYGGAVFRSHR